MNILITNFYKKYLEQFDYSILKEVEGEYSAKDIVSLLENQNYNKVIIDLTAIKNYKDLSNIREITSNIDSSKIIILLANEPTTTSEYYVANIINMGIYNYTIIPGEIVNLIQSPRNYEQAKQYKINN